MFVTKRQLLVAQEEGRKLKEELDYQREVHEETRRNHKVAVRDLSTQHRDELYKRDEEIKVLKRANEALIKNKDKEAELLKKELELETQEVIILNTTTEHTLFEEKLDDIRDEYEAKLTKLTEEVEQEERKDYKEGYANGLADGLREATKITAEDRQLLAKVASIAAASHTPEGVTELLLESGKKDCGK